MIEQVPRILLVEDDAGDALLVSECLYDTGAQPIDVIWERTLAGAIRAMDRQPDCVILDLGLPDASQLSALYRMLATARDTPVIVLTDCDDRAFGDRAVAAGAQDYLVKDDITPQVLERTLRHAVERRRAQLAELALRAEQQRSAENARLERGLLPIPRLRSDLVSCATYYQPGRTVSVLGGDFFDVVETAEGRIRAVIGDVMGHGPDEAALGVHLRVAWRTLVLAGLPDTEILPNLTRLLSAETGGLRGFVTVCDVSIEPDLALSVRLAGHPAPLVSHGARTSSLDVETGPPLGVEGLWGANRRWADTGGWPQTTIEIGPDTTLLLYTDGLLDSYRLGEDHASIGLDELIEATGVCVASGHPVSTWLPVLVSGAPATSEDDTAAVVLRTRGRSV